MEALMKVQQELKAPKSQNNKFGGYKYRSCEDILEAVKPLLAKHKSMIIISDKVRSVGDRVYVEATAEFICGGESILVQASAREAVSRKGMDDSQITGATSSYARKYALNGLLLIDDTKDADSGNIEAEQAHRQKEEDLKKYRNTFKKSIAKYDFDIVRGEFENDGVTAKSDDPAVALGELVGKVTSIEKLRNIGTRVKDASDKVKTK